MSSRHHRRPGPCCGGRGTSGARGGPGAPAALRRLVVPQGQARPRRDDAGRSRPRGRGGDRAAQPASARSLGDVHYTVPDGPQARAVLGGARRCGGEFVAELRGRRAALARRREGRPGVLSYRHDVDVLHRFADVGVPDATVLLVRHAKAGSRSQWEGDDDLRPLSGQRPRAGRSLARAAAAVRTRPVVAAHRRSAATTTVAPLAASCGLPVRRSRSSARRATGPTRPPGWRGCASSARPCPASPWSAARAA